MPPQLSAPVRLLMFVALRIYRAIALHIMRLRSQLPVLGTSSSTGEAAVRRVVSGQAWDEFCDALKAAGAALVAPGAPRDALSQAEGYRYLARLARGGLENFVECADVEAPRLVSIANGSRAAPIKLGSDNPDNLYESAAIDGSLEYIVTGTRGTVNYLGLGTQSGGYGSKGGLATVDYIEADALKYDEGSGAKRRFTLILSSERPDDEHNWLKLKPSPREAMFIVRQTFGNRSSETPAVLNIAKRGSFGVPAPLSAATLERGLQSAAIFVAGASMMFARWAHEFQAHENQLPLFDVERSNRAGGDPNIRYYHSYWRLKPEEALRIRFSPPKCRCWNFQLNNHWMESLDYRYHTVHTNSTLARPDEAHPSTFTIIVAHTDPNAGGRFRGNWISTVGHERGTMCFRWVAAEVPDAELPHPQTDVCILSELP